MVFIDLDRRAVNDHVLEEKKVDVTALLHWRDHDRNLESNSQRSDSRELGFTKLNQRVNIRVRIQLIVYLAGAVGRALVSVSALIAAGSSVFCFWFLNFDDCALNLVATDFFGI